MGRRRAVGGHRDAGKHRPFGRELADEDVSMSTPGVAQASGADQERQILTSLSDLRDTAVREVMTPRVDVVALPIPLEAPDIAQAVRESGHRTFPVYDDDLDHLIGVLFVNDLFRAGWQLAGNGEGEPDDTGEPCSDRSAQPEMASLTSDIARPTTLDLSRRVRQPYLVPESRMVLDVLAEMRRARRAFAVVVDEYGGVAGVLTIKALLSAIVGDLHDELDPTDEPEIVRVDRKRWLIDGGTGIDEVRDTLHLPIPDGEYVTLGGFLFDLLGHIPVEGENVEHDGWQLRIVEMDRRRMAKVVAQAPPNAGEDTADA
jgi:CBS domain containing-hemolysin-like protein